jgi:2-polyprenyl-3-methyl-5-hydroxy-6-metoxy-1,4-benzoquinol methylase
MYKMTYDMERSWKDVMEELAEDDVHAEFYDSSNPFVRYLHRKRLGFLKWWIAAERAETVLEAGCGDGFLLETLEGAGASLTGVELSETRIERARVRAPHASLIQADIREMPVPSQAYDATICTEVLEHVPDPQRAVSELKRVTKPGGIVLVTVPNELNWRLARAALLRFPVRIPDHVNSFSRRSMNRMFGMAPIVFRTLPPLGTMGALTYCFVYRIPHSSTTDT